MIEMIKKMWVLFTPQQKRQVLWLQAFVVIISLFEILTIGSVAGFMKIVGDIEQTSTYPVFSYIYTLLDNSNERLVAVCAFGLVFILTTSALLSVLTTKKINDSAFSIGRQIAVQLYAFYQYKNWLYHTQVNSNWIISRTVVETDRLSAGVLFPLLVMTSRFILILLIMITLFIYSPIVTMAGAFLFISGYLVVFYFAKPLLARNSKAVTDANHQRIRSLNEGFEGIKNVLLLNKQHHFIRKFEDASVSRAEAQASNITLSNAPRYMMEWLAYVSMALLVLFFIIIQQRELTELIPVLALYGISAFKLLPALQQAYIYFSSIKSNFSVIDDLSDDIKASKYIQQNMNEKGKPFVFNDRIDLNNISFTYPKKDKKVIQKLSLTLNKNQTIGVVGPSGSGKSTLIDILCGLIEIEDGDFLVDGVDIRNDLTSWRKNIGYVPQTIVLTDSTMAENIAFGVPYDQIDFNQISKTIKLANLESLVDSLEDGLDTRIGERGVKLSGGQRQRIGIARALYNDANILIFDEATSALDGISEKQIMEAIHDIGKQKTIIMIAHRLKTVQDCDQIYFINEGRLEDQGTYQELLESNTEFREMATHA